MFDMQKPPLVRTGRRPPVSFWDQEWEHLTGSPPPKGHHYIIGEGLVSSEDLYQRDLAEKGRPLLFTLVQASAIKSAYWRGDATIVQLAEEWNTTRVTIRRLVHGETYWYA